MSKKMYWNVYRNDFNKREIEVFDVFTHARFREDVTNLLKKKLPRNEFAIKLKSIAMYNFWSKCEYEVVITSWPPRITNEELTRLNTEESDRCRPNVRPEIGAKIDIYDQLKLNWDRFVDYVYKGE